MKEVHKHKIDTLMENAKAGDASAQLKLAKEFNKGRIVEKSIDNARYWAFKAVSGGNTSAEPFYNSIASDYQASASEKLEMVIHYFNFFPWAEVIGAILLYIILPSEVTPKLVLNRFIIVGLVSLFIMTFIGKIMHELFNLDLNKVKALLIIIVHIVCITISCL